MQGYGGFILGNSSATRKGGRRGREHVFKAYSVFWQDNQFWLTLVLRCCIIVLTSHELIAKLIYCTSISSNTRPTRDLVWPLISLWSNFKNLKVNIIYKQYEVIKVLTTFSVLWIFLFQLRLASPTLQDLKFTRPPPLFFYTGITIKSVSFTK